MATGSLFVKVLVMYFAINIILFAGGYSVGSSLNQVISNTDLAALSNATSAQNYTLGSISNNLTATGAIDVNQQTGGTTSSLLSFIDVLRAVRSFINFVVSMFLNIPFLFLIFPPAVQLFVGVPFALIAGLGIAFYVRSGT